MAESERLEDLDAKSLRALRPKVGEVMQARIDELLKVAPEPKKGAAVAQETDSDMNRWEQDYANMLEDQRQAGEIRGWEYEPEKLRLAKRTWYTPDFRVVRADGRIEFHEVKGFWRDDARVKIKVAARLHPYRFLAVQKIPKGDGGGWKYEEIAA